MQIVYIGDSDITNWGTAGTKCTSTSARMHARSGSTSCDVLTSLSTLDVPEDDWSAVVCCGENDLSTSTQIPFIQSVGEIQ